MLQPGEALIANDKAVYHFTGIVEPEGEEEGALRAHCDHTEQSSTNNLLLDKKKPLDEEEGEVASGCLPAAAARTDTAARRRRHPRRVRTDHRLSGESGGVLPPLHCFWLSLSVPPTTTGPGAAFFAVLYTYFPALFTAAGACNIR